MQGTNNQAIPQEGVAFNNIVVYRRGFEYFQLVGGKEMPANEAIFKLVARKADARSLNPEELRELGSAPPPRPSEKIDLVSVSAEAERMGNRSQLVPNTNENIAGMLRIRAAQSVLEYAAQLPPAKELYPVLVVENELTIVFADTGIGKTVFAMQMGIQIAKTGSVVLYVDLELNDRQFFKRYKDDNGLLFQFPPNFYRVDFTPRFQAPKGMDYLEYFIQSLEEAIELTGAGVVIIDNQTKLAAGDTDSAKTAIPVLENLSRLKFDCGLTIVVLEHNKKVDSSRPISLNDLQGSKMKSNFADAVFSIGRSQTDKYLRYVKQLKVRSAEHVYDTENVATYEITTEGGHLHFEPIGFGSEFDFIRQITGDEKADKGSQRYAQIQELRSQGYKGGTLSEKIGLTKSNISKIERKYGSNSYK